jgi:hypothetical protein
MLLVIFGMLFGGFLGYVTAWRLARKLEHYDVVLADWDQQIDLAAKPPAQIAKYRS